MLRQSRLSLTLHIDATLSLLIGPGCLNGASFACKEAFLLPSCIGSASFISRQSHLRDAKGLRLILRPHFCSALQSVPLADDPQAWPGLPGGQGSSNVTGNTSSAETSENESDAAAGKLGKGVPTMADQIARARSGTPSGQKEEGKKRLTNLNGWSKAGGEVSDVLEGKHRGEYCSEGFLLACSA